MLPPHDPALVSATAAVEGIAGALTIAIRAHKKPYTHLSTSVWDFSSSVGTPWSIYKNIMEWQPSNKEGWELVVRCSKLLGSPSS